MKKLNLKQSIEFLNKECGYIDVENDADYTQEEIIKIANAKYQDKKNCEHQSFEMRFDKLLSQEYEGEVVLLYKAICNDCGKRVKKYDEEKIYQY